MPVPGVLAGFRLQIFSELKNRRVNDVLIAVCDGLKGLPEAITTTWERTIVQTCVVHLIRNSFGYVGRQHRDQIAKALWPVYTTPSEAAAKERFVEFAAQWAQKFRAIIRLWENAWAEFVPFLEYDVEMRRVICTTNAIESINAQYRRPSRLAVTSRILLGDEMPVSSDPVTGPDRRQGQWIMRWNP